MERSGQERGVKDGMYLRASGWSVLSISLSLNVV